MTKENTSLAVKTTAVAQFNFFDPEQFATMQRVAGMFANSELVPDMYKVSADNPKEKAISNCVIAIDIANRIGANVLMVMQNLVIIYGRPSWSSKFLIATINTCGRFEPLKFKFEKLNVLSNYKYKEYENSWENGKKTTKVVEKIIAGPIDNIQCIAYTTPKGSEEVLESSPVSVEMALNEGWYTKKGSKWTTMTKQMLMYRAASFWTSTYAPELSMGMKTEDEVRDIVDVDYEDVTAKAEKELADKANRKEIVIPANEKPAETPQEKPAATVEPEKKVMDKMTVPSLAKAKETLINDFGVAPEVLTDDASIHQVANAHGFEIVIKATGGPGF